MAGCESGFQLAGFPGCYAKICLTQIFFSWQLHNSALLLTELVRILTYSPLQNPAKADKQKRWKPARMAHIACCMLAIFCLCNKVLFIYNF
jgi:hypothetical protein